MSISEMLAQIIHTLMQIAAGVELIWFIKLIEAGVNIFTR